LLIQIFFGLSESIWISLDLGRFSSLLSILLPIWISLTKHTQLYLHERLEIIKYITFILCIVLDEHRLEEKKELVKSKKLKKELNKILPKYQILIVIIFSRFYYYFFHLGWLNWTPKALSSDLIPPSATYFYTSESKLKLNIK